MTGIRRVVGAMFLASALLAAASGGAAHACVGRTISIGYFDAPDQLLVANILSVFIDERTGTTVQLVRFAGREEAFDALRKDRISLYADHSAIVLAEFAGGKPAVGEESSVARLKDVLNRKSNVVWIDAAGYDRSFSAKGASGGNPGATGLLLCKDALGKFPALPKLLGKLRGVLDNETMSSLLREAKGADPRAVARRFLKARKLI